MAKRICLWALLGAAVAFLWFLYFTWLTWGAYHGGPAFNFSAATEILVNITAPVRPLFGRRHAISWQWSLALNAGIYACIGLAVELARMAFVSASLRPRH